MKRISLLILSFLSFAFGYAQDVCTINGSIDKQEMVRSKKPVTTVYLTFIDEFDVATRVDSATVRRGKFQFKRKLTANEPALVYTLTGFDNGALPLFVEPGVVNIYIPDASYPLGASVTGTKNNDLYAEYKAIAERTKRVQIDTLNVMRSQMGEQAFQQWMDSEEGNAEWMRIGANELVRGTAERLQFILEHNDSPLAPLMLEKEIYFTLANEYATNMLHTLSPTLKSHPYYRSYSNVVRALDLKEGSIVPDITIPLADGTVTTLEAFRGKYVLLDFWASWCGPCRKEIPHLIQLFDEMADKRDKFVIVSFSLDNKEKLWRDAIASLGMNKEGWVHGSDLLAWGSPAARMMGVTTIPKAILIDPEGRVVSFSLRGEGLVNKVKQLVK